MTRVRTPCVWVGGKIRLASWISQYLPTDCKIYVEPFGGSAAILLQRQPCKIEVYNDLDGALVTFMLCVKNHYDELCREIRELPYSRELFISDIDWFRCGCPGRLTDIQFSARWWYVNLLSFGARMQSFGTSVSNSRIQQYLGRIDDVYSAHKRLLSVLIEHDDFRTIIRRYDTSESLFYCDPPYLGAEGVYDSVDLFTEQDHIELAEALNTAKGKVVVSYYPYSLIDELYPTGKWHRISRQWSKALAGTTRGQRELTTRRPKSNELLMMNFDPLEDKMH